jgi:arylsulfatase A-like enzyme
MRRAALLLVLGTLAAGQERPPNVILILADDLGWTDLGCYGHPFHETPNLDRLAAQGLRNTQAYANAPNCAPTRAALMSGQYAPRTGIYTVGSAERGKAKQRKLIPVANRTVLAEGVVTLAEAFRAGGYLTACMGKWHLGPDPRTQGFDVNVAGGSRGSPRSYHSPYGNPALEDGPEGEYLTDRLGSEAARFIGRHVAEPFFLYLPFYSVHTPIQGRADLKAHYARKAEDTGAEYHVAYAAMVSAQDQAVGRVLSALEAHELVDDTLVVYFSDNGGHGRFTNMAPLRGSKGQLFEGGIREPLIVRWPGRVPAGSTSDVPQIGIDLYPTLLAAAGIAQPEAVRLDGIDLLPLWTRGVVPEREALFFHFPAYLEAYLPEQGHWRITPSGAVRAGRWKLIERFEDGALELYDLESDPGEARECSEAHPRVTERLHALLAGWRAETGAPVPDQPNPAYAD